MIQALIADDEQAVYSIISQLVFKNKLPINIQGWVGSGRAAIDFINRNRPDLVFLDIQMPVLNGFEVMEACPDVKYIVITAYESFQYAQQALRLGARDILLKPIDSEQFRRSVIGTVGWKITDSSAVNTVLEHLHTHLADPIDLRTLSGMVFMTPANLSRLFKKHVGVSVMAYLHSIRIQQAVILLSEGRCGVKEAAARTGYESLNNFYKHFKEQTGMTPASFCAGGQSVKIGQKP